MRSVGSLNPSPSTKAKLDDYDSAGPSPVTSSSGPSPVTVMSHSPSEGTITLQSTTRKPPVAPGHKSREGRRSSSLTTAGKHRFSSQTLHRSSSTSARVGSSKQQTDYSKAPAATTSKNRPSSRSGSRSRDPSRSSSQTQYAAAPWRSVSPSSNLGLTNSDQNNAPVGSRLPSFKSVKPRYLDHFSETGFGAGGMTGTSRRKVSRGPSRS
eukprot:TRINITY_DN3696_c0_g2_i7.p1 TRINITY_DN3696_c0_g2~~TRINITY_DN3696_c0_g2_i7.p1  ORF type:complete len:210 (-),score=23.47 TRINITY_DN3696_c0_g2_i7:285-914(-)